jgi:hypothetical protein
MAIALAATLALPTLATAQAGLPQKDYPYPRKDNVGTPPGASTAQGQVTNRGRARVTTGEGYSGGRAGPAPKRTHKRMIERWSFK